MEMGAKGTVQEWNQAGFELEARLSLKMYVLSAPVDFIKMTRMIRQFESRDVEMGKE